MSTPQWPGNGTSQPVGPQQGRPQSAQSAQSAKGGAKGPLLAILLFFVALIGVGAGVAFFVLARNDLGGRTDVGDLEALGGVQAQLRPIDACRMEFNTRTVGANQDKGDHVRIYACDAEMFAAPVRMPVPENWPYRKQPFSFMANRSSKDARWAIAVHQSQVAFPDLVKALESIAPSIASGYANARANLDAQEKASKETLRRAEEEQERARQKAKGTYPTK